MTDQPYTGPIKVRYIGDEARQVSILPGGSLRTLEPDELFTVPAAHGDSYACQPELFDVSSDDHAPRK